MRISLAERGESLIISNQEPRVEYCGTVAGRICSWPYKEYGPSLQNSASTSYVISFAIFHPTTIIPSTPKAEEKYEQWHQKFVSHVSRNIANNHFSPWGSWKTEIKSYDQHSRLTDGGEVWWELHRGDVLPVTQTQYCKKYRWSLQTFFLWRHEKNLYCDTIICVLCH